MGTWPQGAGGPRGLLQPQRLGHRVAPLPLAPRSGRGRGVRAGVTASSPGCPHCWHKGKTCSRPRSQLVGQVLQCWNTGGWRVWSTSSGSQSSGVSSGRLASPRVPALLLGTGCQGQHEICSVSCCWLQGPAWGAVPGLGALPACCNRPPSPSQGSLASALRPGGPPAPSAANSALRMRTARAANSAAAMAVEWSAGCPLEVRGSRPLAAPCGPEGARALLSGWG